jgi:4-amino-4-deoxy-L-arabinose transferase-like glycosyltransferase
VVIAAAFFVASAPTLDWLEFSSSMENLVVATALETRRDHHWLVPTLEGEPRVAKPPLATWLAAAAITPATFRALDSPDFLARAAAYKRLAWEVRWPALLASCVMLLAVFDLGRTIGGSPVGLLAMTVCGSSLFLLRFGRQMTTDVQLALWVTVTNAALARLVLRGRSWPAALAAGVALGLALMSKGPVALLQTILPVLAFVLWRGRGRTRLSLRQLLVATLIMLLVGGAWYLYVATSASPARSPEQPMSLWQRWRVEVLRSGSANKQGNPLSYLTLFLYLLPWTAVFIHGLLWSIVEAWRARRHQMLLPPQALGMVLAMFLVVVPVIVMSFFPDRQERYLLPLAGPASVLAVRALLAMLDPDARAKIPPWVQWAIVFVIAVGLPIAGATVLKRADGRPWYPRQFAIATVVRFMLVILVAHQFSLRAPAALVIGSAVVMLLLQPVFFVGYRDAREGRAEMRPLAEVIRDAAPDAALYYWRPQGPKRMDVSLSIYSNRETRWVGDAAGLEPLPNRAQVMITQQREGAPPRQPPPGWDFLAKAPRDKDVYWAFVRPPAPGKR